jgi:anti-sigma factor RsiW
MQVKNAMCDQRERLIGYVYDECDEDERRTVETHLKACETCRDEIGSLRGTRLDLMAWQVPPHEPVWRPMAAPRQAPSWRDVPAWAMAAAASAIFLTGAAGGVATRVLWPVASQAPMAAAAYAPAAVPASVTTSDLAQFREALLTDVRSEMDRRLVAVPAHDTASVPVSARDVVPILERLHAIEQWQRAQIELNAALDQQMRQIGTRTTSVSEQMQLNRQLSRLQRVGLHVGQ